MLFASSPDSFVLGIAVGVLGLVLLLSLIVSYAYEEPTLFGLAAYLALMVGAPLLGKSLQVDETWMQKCMLVLGPVLMAAMQMWLLRNRKTTVMVKVFTGMLLLFSLGLLGFYGVTGPAALELPLVLAWSAVLLVFTLYLMVDSWQTAGPWKWWLLLGQGAALTVALAFLTGTVQAESADWAVLLLLLLQVPPIYLSLVWRSRLLNESRLRISSADVTDPLTGLATLSVMVERLMRVMSRAHQTKSVSAIFLIEVQNWSGLLQQLGADFNEKMLLEAALRLRRAIGDNDLAARIGGRRFAVVAQGLSNEAEVSALAARLMVSGLRIDSPLLPGVEFHFRVVVSSLKVSRPLALPATHQWLMALAENFQQWPSTHRSRSILVVAENDQHARDGLQPTLPAGVGAQ
jgi:diguanylate cyclase (GGDEF)-like protein